MYLSKQSVRDIEKKMGNKQIHLRRLYNIVNKQRKKNNQLRLNAKIQRSLTAGAKQLPKPFSMTLDDTSYTITHELMSGVSGQVFKGTTGNEQVVIKKMPKTNTRADVHKAFNREVAAFSEIKKYEGSERIIKLRASHEDETAYYLVFPFLENEDFLEIIDNKKANAKQQLKMLSQVVEGLHFLHTINIAHLDLKLENVFVDKDLNIKIGDFGFAENVSTKDEFDSFQGTHDYMSPEIHFSRIRRRNENQTIPLSPFMRTEYGKFLVGNNATYSGKRADAWALGILFCIVLFETNVLPPLFVKDKDQLIGIHPHFEIVLKFLTDPEKTEFFNYLEKQHRDSTFQTLSSEMQTKWKTWIRGLMQYEPSKRMTVADLYEEMKTLNF